MQIDLYRTLNSINVTDDQAKLAVDSLQAYMEKMMSDATKPLQEKLDSTKAELGAKIDCIQ